MLTSSTRNDARSGCRGVLLAVGVVLALLAGAFAIKGIRAVTHRVSGAGEVARGTGREWVASLPGPWGELEQVRIAIERPDEFITLSKTFKGQDRWFFQGYSTDQLAAFFQTNALTRAQREVLLDRGHWGIQSNGITVIPDPTTILDLKPEARQRIYNVLAESPENYYQYLAFRYREDGFSEWFNRSGLSDEVMGLVKPLLYRRGTALCFSDLNEVLARIASPDEQRRLVKTLSRVSTLLVRLKVGPDTDVGALVRYWGKEGRAKDLNPLLQSLANLPDGGLLDVAHLLPPFARMRLYTYPFPSEDPHAAHRDCFWSSMNFFAEEPDDRFCEFAATQEAIRSQYYPIQDEPTYGDILWLVNDQGRAVHAAVYIAADIVFTKNGARFDQPWVLMQLRDLLAVFTSERPLRLVAYRLKNV
ncbi:MAG TPA: hypothetical protein PKJ98_21015 [Verrucomicrobiota bacterium]|nr:hypothetical protein [Verrucomicrobiota bacterium]